MVKRIIANLICTALVVCAPRLAVAQHEAHGESHEAIHTEDAHAAHGDHAEHAHAESFNAGKFISHHLADANDIHFWGDLHAPLPMIMYVEGKGVDFFMSSAFH